MSVFPAVVNEAYTIDEFISALVTKKRGRFSPWILVRNSYATTAEEIEVLTIFIKTLVRYLPISLSTATGSADSKYALMLYENEEQSLPTLALSSRTIQGIRPDQLPDLLLWVLGENQREGVERHYYRFFDQLRYCQRPSWLNTNFDISTLLRNRHSDIYISQEIRAYADALRRFSGKEIFVLTREQILPGFIVQPVLWGELGGAWFFVSEEMMEQFYRTL